ncbi:MAG TPA: LuxR family transcriptional regulator [Polyangia bacterium]|jgi:DNA-binding CsgD family transcriptional regulator|nr:LuxR family transcriptional regulator [Polyangia bacterium]
MSERFEGACDALKGSRSYEELGGVMERTIRALGFACYSYVDVRPLWLPGEPAPFYLTTLPPGFVRGYAEEALLPYDPLVLRAASTNAPFLWSACTEFHTWTRPRRGKRSKAERVFELSYEHGLTSALEIPLHAVDRRGRPAAALISFYWQHDPSCLAEPSITSPWLRLIAAYFHERVLELRGQGVMDPEDPPPSLSDRERECLLWACRGKTRGETADILGVSERTVEFHFEKAMRKLGVHNKTHAIATAIHLGLICP